MSISTQIYENIVNYINCCVFLSLILMKFYKIPAELLKYFNYLLQITLEICFILLILSITNYIT